MEEVKEWLQSLEEGDEFFIYTNKDLKTKLVLNSNIAGYEFENQTDEIKLMVDATSDFSWIRFQVVSYLWSMIINEHSETVGKVYVWGNDLYIDGDSNTYVLEKQLILQVLSNEDMQEINQDKEAN